MSFPRPKLRYKRRRKDQSSESTASTSVDKFSSLDGGGTLVSGSDSPQQKRPRYSKDPFLPGPEELGTLPGGLTLPQTPVSHTSNYGSVDSEDLCRRSSPEISDGGTNIDHIGGQRTLKSRMEGDESRRQRRQKKARISAKWTTDVIPSLVPIYLRLLRETKSLRLSPTVPVSSPCLCTSSRSLTVTCVFFQRKFSMPSLFFASSKYRILLGIESIVINICTCSSAASQLLSRGLFPCAPSFPSLAVDLALLNFTRNIFVRLPPNITSFTEAIKSFLKDQGYKLGQVRKRKKEYPLL